MNKNRDLTLWPSTDHPHSRRFCLLCARASALEIKDVTYDTNGGGKVIFSQGAPDEEIAAPPNVSCKTCHTQPGKSTSYPTLSTARQGPCPSCSHWRPLTSRSPLSSSLSKARSSLLLIS